MAVYLAGGYIEGSLSYHWWQYEKKDGNAPDVFILFGKEERPVLQYFESVGWAFPEAYRRIEMRQASENMGGDLRTVLYVRKEEMNYEQ